jgi:DNA-binding MarR family transcriptional regulator
MLKIGCQTADFYDLWLKDQQLAVAQSSYDNLGQHYLSERLGLSKSTVSGIVNRLVAQKIVVREIPEENRRTVKLSLEQKFIQVNDLIKLRDQFFAQIVATATVEEVETITAGLDQALNGYYQGIANYLIAQAKLDHVVGKDISL